MVRKKEDEIMAEYLLKGGKMLEKTCRQCGCPQFEYKKKTFCVVCAEREQEEKTEQAQQTGQESPPSLKPAGTSGGADLTGGPVADSTLAPELAATILDLCRRIRNEEDPDRCHRLMDAIKLGTEALQILRQV